MDVMKFCTIAFLSAFAILGSACASSKYAEDPNATKTKAHKAYSDLDQETGSPHVNQRDVRNGDIDRYSKNSGTTANFSGPTPTIMVMPSASEKGSSALAVVSKNPLSKAMMESINSYLTQKHYEVKSLEGQAQLDEVIKMQNDIANTEDDLSYLASLALGADIYIKYSGSATTDHVTVEVNAYETSTGRLLGSQTAEVKNNGHTSETNLRANVQSAARKAMPNLEQKILSYWKSDLQKGLQYKVVMNLKGEYTDSQIEDLHDIVVKNLKSSFSSVTVNVLTDKTIDVVVYALPDQFADSQEVYSHIRQQLKPAAETKKINLTKKLILMDLR